MGTSTENAAIVAHRKLVMGRRVRQLATHIAAILPEDVMSMLDVGAGTGEMAQAINGHRPEVKIIGVDVYIRPKTFIPVSVYDGTMLPFEEKSFDAVMLVDVLHHCQDQAAVLQECARVSRRWVVLKDHVSDSLLDEAILRFMDWVGNRAHGVVLPFNYLSSPDWSSALDKAGLRTVRSIDKLSLYPFPFDLVFGGSLHCLHLLSKS